MTKIQPISAQEAKNISKAKKYYNDLEQLILRINSHLYAGTGLTIYMSNTHLVEIVSLYRNVGWNVTFKNDRDQYEVTFSFDN